MTVVSASEPLDRQLSFKSFSVPSGPVCGFHTWFYFFFFFVKRTGGGDALYISG